MFVWASETLQVDSVTSSEAQVPFLYYSLPFCQGKGGLKKRKESLGAKLSGLGRFNSPYELRVNVRFKARCIRCESPTV